MGTTANVLELFDDAGKVVSSEEVKDTDELDDALNPEPEKKAEPEPEPEKKEPEAKVEPEPEKKEVAEEKQEPEKKDEVKEEKVTVTSPEEENTRLRILARDQKRDLALLKARLERLEKTVVTDDESVKDVVPAKVEELQTQINKIGETRGPVFDVLLETMELSPKYADVREVCSQDNLDFIVTNAAEVLASKENRDPVEVALELEVAIWSEKNPYRAMYELIKTYHPKYKASPAKDDASKKTETEKKTETTEKKTVKEPAKAPATIADAGTGSKVNLSGWTAARIDSMEEEELDKVPADVYEKYMQGLLD